MDDKTFIKLAADYQKARTEYYKHARGMIRKQLPLSETAFWPLLHHLTTCVDNSKDIKAAVYNWYVCPNTPMHPDSLEYWALIARFAKRYQLIRDELYKACWDLPKAAGVHKGDDSYEDWIDALPLGGKLLFDLLRRGVYSYQETWDHIEEMWGAAFTTRIMEGENYIRMTIEDLLVERFPSIADGCGFDQIPEGEETFTVICEHTVSAPTVAEATALARKLASNTKTCQLVDAAGTVYEIQQNPLD